MTVILAFSQAEAKKGCRTLSQWLKFVSNLTKKSDRFFAPPSPSRVSAAMRALFASFVKEVVYKANVEQVTISLENAYFARLEGQGGFFLHNGDDHNVHSTVSNW